MNRSTLSKWQHLKYTDCEEEMKLKVTINRITRWEELLMDMVSRKRITIVKYGELMSLCYKKSMEAHQELSTFLQF